MLITMGRLHFGLASLALLGACGFSIPGGAGTPDDAMDIDGVGGDGASAVCPWPYTPEYAMPCPAKMGPAIELLGGKPVLDTDAGTLMSGLTSIDMFSEVTADVRVVWTTGLNIGMDANVRVTGSLPLVIISTGAITIDGVLDGAGHATSPIVGDNPPGANPSECNMVGGTLDTGAGPGQPCGDQGASGGGGGSFAETGGQGGGGGNEHFCDSTVGVGPVPGGTFGVSLSMRPTNLRGGCPGAFGGQSLDTNASAGRAGSGGGAIALVARTTLSIGGKVNVGGGGGGGGSERSGGGGGGSGGMIVLEATTISITMAGRVSANGGGGGGGADGGTAGNGEDGRDTGGAANGGSNAGSGTDGGTGGARGDLPTAASISSRGGGGGGGGVGFVRLHATTSNADPNSISPPPSP